MTRGHRGSLHLRCRAFSSPPPCRFIPAHIPFPPPAPRSPRRPCSSASQVLRDRPTSHTRSSQDYRLGVPWASRPLITRMGGRGISRFSRMKVPYMPWFFDHAGLTLAALVVRHLLGPDEPILLAVDETLFRRRGPKVHAIGWWHDGSAAGRKVGLGNSWVVAAIIVRLPFLTRPVALPVLAALCTKPGPSKPALARELR